MSDHEKAAISHTGDSRDDGPYYYYHAALQGPPPERGTCDEGEGIVQW